MKIRGPQESDSHSRFSTQPLRNELAIGIGIGIGMLPSNVMVPYSTTICVSQPERAYYTGPYACVIGRFMKLEKNALAQLAPVREALSSEIGP